MIEPSPVCALCSLPDAAVRLVRMNWITDKDDSERLMLAVAKAHRINDILVCEPCIRDLKRLPFSEFVEAGSTNKGNRG